jgi:predicted lipoprotein
MNKSVSIAALLVAVATIALSSNAVAAPKAPSAASAASSAHVHHDADATKANLKAAKARGELMSACQKKAAEANLHDTERKDFLTACMAGK